MISGNVQMKRICRLLVSIRTYCGRSLRWKTKQKYTNHWIFIGASIVIRSNKFLSIVSAPRRRNFIFTFSKSTTASFSREKMSGWGCLRFKRNSSCDNESVSSSVKHRRRKTCSIASHSSHTNASGHNYLFTNLSLAHELLIIIHN